MTLQNIYCSIDEEIFRFQCKYGTMPNCIFMSKSLIEYVKASESLVYNYDNKNTGMIGKFHGINVRTYEHPEPQYYLAEGPGMFKEYY